MVSIKAPLMLTVLVTLFILSSDTSAAYIGCCRRYMKGKLRFQSIKGYSVQNVTEMCRISAIIFHTKMGQACADPALDWVMVFVNRIRYMAQKVHQSAQAVNSTLQPEEMH